MARPKGTRNINAWITVADNLTALVQDIPMLVALKLYMPNLLAAFVRGHAAITLRGCFLCRIARRAIDQGTVDRGYNTSLNRRPTATPAIAAPATGLGLWNEVEQGGTVGRVFDLVNGRERSGRQIKEIKAGAARRVADEMGRGGMAIGPLFACNLFNGN